MKPYRFFLCLLTSLFAQAAQSQTDSNTYFVRPHFKLGETRTYLVKEESRTVELIRSAHVQNVFKVRFTVLDTTDGYKLSYRVEMVSSKNRNWKLATIVAKISDNLNLKYKIGDSGFVTDFYNMREARSHLLQSLDQLERTEHFTHQDTILIGFLRRALREPTGPEICLLPMCMFNNIFNMLPYQDHKNYIAATRYDIFNQPGIPGVLITELKNMNKASGSVLLEMDFLGNPDSAAKYNAPLYLQMYQRMISKPLNPAYLPPDMRNDFEREYEMERNSGWPIKISDKSIQFYMQKVKKWVSMEMIEE